MTAAASLAKDTLGLAVLYDFLLLATCMYYMH